MGGASGGGRSVGGLCLSSSLGLFPNVRGPGGNCDGFAGTEGEFVLFGVSEGYGSLCEGTVHFIFFNPLYCLVSFRFFV